MGSLVCVGGQWGDEGKGKMVDLLSEACEFVVRFQGGNNAGHTLVVNDQRTVLHLIPSGILHPGKICVIGNGVVVDPEILLQEVETLTARGLLNDKEPRLFLSPRCHIITPYHKRLDIARENARSEMRIGTTGRGIGPCYEDKIGRRGLRLFEMMDASRVAERVRQNVLYINALLDSLGSEPFSGREIEQCIERLRSCGERLKPMIKDTTALLNDALARGKNILFEGAQGAMLDVDHGTYPYVTSSNCVAAHASAGAGIGMSRDTHVMMVAKAYTTRVGAGPMPVELLDEEGEALRERGKEFGATTGRPRRCGWLDLVALRYAAQVHGADSLVITKLDILAGYKTLKVCTAYEIDGKRVEHFPWDERELMRAKPIYVEVAGYEAIGHKGKELPQAVRKYLDLIEKFVKVPVLAASIGPGRGEEVWLRPRPFTAG